MSQHSQDWFHIFDDFQDCVYIADVHTYELVYVNGVLQEAFGLDSPEAYQGKKCHEILQNSDTPCTFCNNHKLSYGTFTKWVYCNPITKYRYNIKDTLVSYKGQTLRLEIATCIDDTEEIKDGQSFFLHHSELVGKCLKLVYTAHTPVAALETILRFTGFQFSSEYAFLATYEEKQLQPILTWTKPNTDILPLSEFMFRCNLWEDLERQKKSIVLDNIEQFSQVYPFVVKSCQMSHITNIVIEPLCFENRLLGFIGVANVPENQKATLISFLAIIRYFIVTLLNNQIAIENLEKLSFYDKLTGARNKSCFLEICQQYQNREDIALGVVYCDISGLKKVNDRFGHRAGDTLIQNCYYLLRKVFEANFIYRVGGDEFVILTTKDNKEVFAQKVKQLKKVIQESAYHIAVGATFIQNEKIDIQKLLEKADKKMYIDKRVYYQKQGLIPREVSDEKQNKRTQYLSGEHISPEDFLNYLYHGEYEISRIFQALGTEDVPYCLFMGDLKSGLFYIPDSMCKKFGIPQNIVTNFFQIWVQKIDMQEERELYLKQVQEALNNQRDCIDLRYKVRDKNEQIMWIRCRSTIQTDKTDGSALFYTGIISWQEQSFVIDPITGFAKEASVLEKLSQIQDSGHTYQVLVFFLNNIRELNEVRGRSSIDRLLQAISQRLSNQLGKTVFFFRLDGVQFLALFRFQNMEHTQNVVNCVKNIIEVTYVDFHVIVKNPCTMVQFIFPQLQQTPQEFLAFALSSLRVAKHNQNFSGQPQEESKQKFKIFSELQQDIMNDFQNFRIVIQPIIDTETEMVVYGEVLLRWKNYSPASFIPILEQNNLMTMVGKWVFEQTVRLCKDCIRYRPYFHLSFNVSYYQILDDSFLNFMKTTLQNYHLDGSYLTIELTETHFDENPERLEEFIKHCREMGISVALDDVGNGYSSLALLLHYSADVIKLDKSILSHIVHEQNNLKFIKSIIYTCHEFGKLVCAEGVETEEEAELVLSAGSDFVQGYYYYRPLEIDQLYKLLFSETKQNGLLHKHRYDNINNLHN